VQDARNCYCYERLEKELGAERSRFRMAELRGNTDSSLVGYMES
jgi:hypothetical protein